MKVLIELVHHWRDKVPGDEVNIEEELANSLISAGVAKLVESKPKK